MSEPLRFGTYVEFQCPPGRDHASLIGDVLALAEHSDKNGFHVFTTLEHPFYEQFAINPNPLAVFTHLAGRTENLRFRAPVPHPAVAQPDGAGRRDRHGGHSDPGAHRVRRGARPPLVVRPGRPAHGRKHGALHREPGNPAKGLD